MDKVNEIFLMDKSNHETISNSNYKFKSKYLMQFIIFLPYYCEFHLQFFQQISVQLLLAKELYQKENL